MTRRKPPTPEDMALWDKVTKTVAPLRPEPAPEPPAEPKTPPKPLAKRRVAQPRPPIVEAKPKPKPAQPPLHPIDRRTRSRVSRGITDIDARIDLHGMTQAAALRELIAFLYRAQASGARMVLVITGKGIGGDGVLRRSVPLWLADPDLRPLVIGFEEADRAHGGSGALLIRMRRKR